MIETVYCPYCDKLHDMRLACPEYARRVEMTKLNKRQPSTFITNWLYWLIALGICFLFISIIVSCVPVAQKLAPDAIQVQVLNLGRGLSFQGTPVAIVLPPGHPDFTLWRIVQYTTDTPEIGLIKLAEPGKGYYELLSCETAPIVLGLHYSHKGEDLYWVYQDIVPVPATKEEFKKRKTEAQYLCPVVGQEVKGKEI